MQNLNTLFRILLVFIVFFMTSCHSSQEQKTIKKNDNSKLVVSTRIQKLLSDCIVSDNVYYKRFPKKSIDTVKTKIFYSDSIKLLHVTSDSIVKNIDLNFKSITEAYSETDHCVTKRLVKTNDLVQFKGFKVKDNAIYNIGCLDVDNGLSSSYVLSMDVDKNKRLWIGTYEGGLECFDGTSFLNFNKLAGLPDNSVRTSEYDKNGNLWIGTTSNGICMYDGNYIYDYSRVPEFTSKYIIAIKVDSKNRIWIGTKRDGIFCIKKDSIAHLTKNEGLCGNRILSVFVDNSDNVWVGSNGSGVSCIANNKIINYKFNCDDLLTPEMGSYEINKLSRQLNTVRAFSEVLNNGLFIGTWRGLILFRNSNFTFTQFRYNKFTIKIKSLATDNINHLFIGTPGNGFYDVIFNSVTYEPQWFKNFSTNIGLSNGYVSSFLYSNNILWVGTNGGGINRFDMKSFSHFTENQGVRYNNVWAFAYDKNNKMWLGTERAGIAHYADSMFMYYDEDAGLRSHIILSSMTDKNKNMWFGSYRGGVYKVLNNKLFDVVSKKGDLEESSIRSVYEDSFGVKWFGTWGDGVYRLKKSKLDLISTKCGLSDGNVYDIYEDSQKNMWFATDNGVNKFVNNTFYQYFVDSTTPVKEFRCISEINGEIWIGSYGNGIAILKDSTVRWINHNNGLSSDLVTSIIRDSFGNVWVGTEKGLNLFVCNKSSVDKESFRNKYNLIKFSTKDGLKAEDFLDNSVSIDNKNTIWWGTGKSLACMDLTKLEGMLKSKPIITFQTPIIDQQTIDFRYFDKEKANLVSKNSAWNNVEFSEIKPFFNYPFSMKLPYKLRHVNFRFSAMDDNSLDRIKYQFRLYPFEEDWSSPTSENKVDYRNIPPGDYTFEVFAIGMNGLKSDVIIQHITIIPPWWITIWALISYLVFTVVVVILIIRWRTSMLKNRQKELEHIVKQRTLEISEKNEELVVLIDEVSKQKNEIQQIHQEVSQSIDYAKRIQETMLSSKKMLKDEFDDSFVFFKPRNIVSGDFYWWTKVNNYLVMVVADCTGHGVPGAFMSMLGISLLREIVQKEQHVMPDVILETMRTEVIQSLKQRVKAGELRDGMDMVVFTYNQIDNKCWFAGANNSMYIVRNNEIIEILGDKNPIAVYPKMKPFTLKEIDIQKGDKIYMSSDGFADQFGGEKGTKFMRKNFKKLLIEISKYKSTEQEIELEKAFENWRGDYDQVDDILIVGIEV